MHTTSRGRYGSLLRALVGFSVGSWLFSSLVGCGLPVTGHWKAVKAVPHREVFCIDEATFARDGTYTATTTIEGKTVVEHGRYHYNGYKLRLEPDAGGQRSYTVVRSLDRLEVINGDRKVILKKE